MISKTRKLLFLSLVVVLLVGAISACSKTSARLEAGSVVTISRAFAFIDITDSVRASHAGLAYAAFAREENELGH
jgi:hypothetical protein